MVEEADRPIVTLRFAIGRGLLFALGWMIFMATYCGLASESSGFDPWEHSISAAGAFLALYMGYIGVRQFRVAHEHAQKVRAVDLVHLLGSEDHTSHRVELRRELQPCWEDLNQLRLVIDEKGLRIPVARVLGSLEDLSVALQAGYCDEAIVYRSLAFVVQDFWKKLAGYVQKMRTEEHSPSLYVEVERLARAWGERKSVRNGAKLPVDYSLSV